MIADRAWFKRNLGFDPVSTPAPAATFATRAATKTEPKDEDFQREIIDFDSDGPEGTAFMAFSKATGMSRFVNIPWPKDQGPVTDPKVRKGKAGRLPEADFLVVTWTVDEGHALSRVLTPGKDSRNDYQSYRRNFAAISKKMRKGCPALEANRLGAYWTTTIAGKKVVVFKSDSHMSQDGPQLANADVWKQIIEDVQPKLVITTGTAGGIGTNCEVGDVIVSPELRFDCTSKFKNKPFHDASYSSKPAKTANFAKAKELFATNADQLPTTNTRAPEIVTVAPGQLSSSVVTTDFFGFDTSDNHYKLQGLGDVSEMGDAVLGMVSQQMGASAPPYIAVRNVSDPQIDATGLTLKQQAKMAANIYKGFGRWSSVCSAIVCWALIA